MVLLSDCPRLQPLDLSPYKSLQLGKILNTLPWRATNELQISKFKVHVPLLKSFGTFLKIGTGFAWVNYTVRGPGCTFPWSLLVPPFASLLKQESTHLASLGQDNTQAKQQKQDFVDRSGEWGFLEIASHA